MVHVHLVPVASEESRALWNAVEGVVVTEGEDERLMLQADVIVVLAAPLDSFVAGVITGLSLRGARVWVVGMEPSRTRGTHLATEAEARQAAADIRSRAAAVPTPGVPDCVLL
jgi:hypothetical protein